MGFFLLGYAALRALELSPVSRQKPSVQDEAPREDPEPAREWEGVIPWGEARVHVRLGPLHEEGGLERFRAIALRERLGLSPGEPWRLLLSLESSSPCPGVVSVRVEDDEGLALVPLSEAAGDAHVEDPLWSLFAPGPGELEPERERPVLLWGRTPEGDEIRIALAGDGSHCQGRLEPAPAALPRWFAGDWGGYTPTPVEAELARLRAELERERARRAERELQFIEFSRLLEGLPTGVLPRFPLDPERAPAGPGAEERAPSPEAPPEDPAALAARSRAEELSRSLSTLMRLEGVRGLDLLEAGTLRGGALGPVIFRVLDERGRLAGSVQAERLRLEASRAAHTVTIVLEDGFESQGGERLPFAGGVRRIALAEVDPAGWIESCPELFSQESRAQGGDDGRWDLGAVKRELNRLLALDTAQGWYRLHSFGGVHGKELVDVQLEEFEASGRLRRRFFADHLQLTAEDETVVLALRDGAIVRGGEKQPFSDGEYRIVLPRALPQEWRSASLPGFAQPPRAEPDAPPPVPGGGGGGNGG